MAKAKKEKADCPPCPDCSQPTAGKAPSVKIVKGEFKPVDEAQEAKDGFSFPGFGYYRKTAKKPCMLDVGKKIQSGRVELDMLTNEESRLTGIRSGPVLRLCVEGNSPGPTLPVNTPFDAQKIAEKFAACAEKGDKSRDQCGIDTFKTFLPGKPVWVTGGEVRAKKKAAVEARKAASAEKKAAKAEAKAARVAAKEATAAAKAAKKAAR
jgi:hypothetical protein